MSDSKTMEYLMGVDPRDIEEAVKYAQSKANEMTDEEADKYMNIIMDKLQDIIGMLLILALGKSQQALKASMLGPVFNSLMLSNTLERLDEFARLCDNFADTITEEATNNIGGTVH